MKGRERGMATRTGINKQGWEMSDFPVACDKCYGENPYMRMLKENYGQECRICFRPFTVFKWKGNKNVYKRTCVCNWCSKEKNVCQVCTLDLEFGLPIDIRDRRCGANGKYLLNEKFLSEENNSAKPPPPKMSPPMRTKAEEKELVFVPAKENQDDELEGPMCIRAKDLVVGTIGDQNTKEQEHINAAKENIEGAVADPNATEQPNPTAQVNLAEQNEPQADENFEVHQQSEHNSLSESIPQSQLIPQPPPQQDPESPID